MPPSFGLDDEPMPHSVDHFLVVGGPFDGKWFSSTTAAWVCYEMSSPSPGPWTSNSVSPKRQKPDIIATNMVKLDIGGHYVWAPMGMDKVEALHHLINGYSGSQAYHARFMPPAKPE